MGEIDAPITYSLRGILKGVEDPDACREEALRMRLLGDEPASEGVGKRENIKELFADFDGEYSPVETDWGQPVGEEIL